MLAISKNEIIEPIVVSSQSKLYCRNLAYNIFQKYIIKLETYFQPGGHFYSHGTNFINYNFY